MSSFKCQYSLMFCCLELLTLDGILMYNHIVPKQVLRMILVL